MRLAKFLPLLLLLMWAAPASAQTVQCQTSSGAWGPCPLNASVQLFTAQAATATATATAQKVYNFSMTGTFIVSFATITGSPSNCTIQVKTGDSLGNSYNNGIPFPITAANGTVSVLFTPAPGFQHGDQISAVYACSAYPSGGTLSLEFVPATVTANQPVYDQTVANLLAQLLQRQGTPATAAYSFILGTFGRRVTSTGDALDVNVKYPEPLNLPSSFASNALTPVRIAALTTTTTVKTSGGNLWAWMVYNPNASACFLDFFNTTSPTLGTTVPIFTISLPATGAANVSPGQFAYANFSSAWSVAAVTATGGATTCSTGVVTQLSIF